VAYRIKLIAIDLDGTLLTSDKEVTKKSIEALEKAMEQGVMVVIATGRPLLGLETVINNVPKSPYILTTNGARVVNLETGEIILEKLISHEVVLQTFDILRKYDCVKEIFYNGQGYIDSAELERIHLYHRKPEMCDYVKRTRKAVPDLMKYINELKGSADKAQGIFNDLRIRDQAWRQLDELGELNLADSLNYNIEINAKGVDKGSSLEFLVESLGIEREKVMAIGDGSNDAGMLEYAGFGVAMGNAKDRIKGIADMVTASNDEDGVAKILWEHVI
jgi:Cof subfamily protein (haloacid dehalogenase superfamily)